MEWNKSLEIREARVKGAKNKQNGDVTCFCYYLCYYVIVVENERRLDEEMFDLKQVKDELRDKRHRCIELEVRNVVIT